jgi:hypothetical protein
MLTSSQKITELEALCKKLREDTQRLEEEKATLEGMVESHDELLMEIDRETGLDHMGEDEDDEEDADDGGDGTAPPAAAPPPPVPPATAPPPLPLFLLIFAPFLSFFFLLRILLLLGERLL